MSCGCHDCNHSSSLGALMDLYGLGALLAAGSRVRVGFELSFFSIYDTQEVINNLEGCLGNTGQFSSLDITIVPSSFGRHYLLVNAETARDFTKTEDFGALVAQTLQLCVPEVSISRRDVVAVDYVPPTAPANAQQQRDAHGQIVCAPGLVWQQGWFGGSCVQPPGSSAPQQPGQCDAEWQQGISNYLACELGVTPNQALMVAGLGAVLALVVVMKIAR